MKVLLATDGSEIARLSEAVLELTPGLSRAEVLVASVCHPVHVPLAGVQPFGTVALGEQIREIEDVGKKHVREVADAVSNRLSERGFHTLPYVMEGDVGHELLALAEDAAVDLIALGSRGLGAIQSLVLGSVARRIVNGARTSVLVAHPFKHRTPAESLQRLQEKTKLRVVVGTDGTPGAAAAIDWLQSAGAGCCERVCAVCAEPLSVVPAGVDPSMFAMVYEYDRERVEAVATHAKEQLSGVAPDVTSFTDIGRPVEVLTEAAEREDADLLMVGATQHGALERFLIGSVSFEVAVRAPCSVLIVRPKPE